jgi:hypothetical protein
MMVDLHRPSRPEPIVVKPARPRSMLRPNRHCVLCDAELRGDHHLGDLTCDCHHHVGYSPRCDPHLDRRVLTLLTNAWPEPLNLLRALGTDDRWCVHDSVNRWRSRGVTIRGVQSVGYRLGSQP